MQKKSQLDFYGTTVSLESSDSYFHDCLSFDFSLFEQEVSQSPSLCFSIESVDELPKLADELLARTQSDKYVVYEDSSYRYVLYFSGVLLLDHKSSPDVKIFTTDKERGYEKLYLALLSRVGEALEERGLYRIHALGFDREGLGNLVLLPMHGGKSSLALELLAEQQLEVLSEDMLLIDNRMQLYPFPLRVGLRQEDKSSQYPDEDQRLIHREGYGPKLLIRAEALKLCPELKPRKLEKIYVGTWKSSGEPELKPISKLLLLKYLGRDFVVGIGLPQVIELFLRNTLADTCSKSWMAVKRGYLALRIAASTKSSLLVITKPLEKVKELLNADK